MKGMLQLQVPEEENEGRAAFNPATHFLYIELNDAPDMQTIVSGDQVAGKLETNTPTSQLETKQGKDRAHQFVNATGFSTWFYNSMHFIDYENWINYLLEYV